MCGRFVSTTSAEELAEYFGAVPPEFETERSPNHNVAPTQGVLAVYESEGVRMLESFHWGLVPFWAKDPKIGSRMINARGETVAEKNSFRRPFARSRCIIPADGFYEWQKPRAGASGKQPYYMSRIDGAPFAFAGLFDVWDDQSQLDSSGEPMRLHSCTIITCEPNDLISDIHDRMPVMLPPSAWDQWLDRDNGQTGELSRLLVAAPSRLIAAHPVSTAVNNVRNNGVELIEPLDVG